VATVSAPVAWTHVTLKPTRTVPPETTVALSGLSPAMVQLADAPSRCTEWLPGARPPMLAVPFAPIGCASPLSMVNAYPSASWLGPLVVVPISMVPVEGGSAVHAMVKVTGATVPADTVTARGLSPSSRQFPASPASPTVCVPAVRSGSETVVDAAMAPASEPSSDTA
jgi:hypothetical protein